jgi:hypothetical protein
MSDTPQNADVSNEAIEQTVEEVSSAASEINGSAVESDTTGQVQTEPEEQEVDEAALARQKATDAFNKQYGEKKQLERDLAAQSEKVQQLEQKERERQASLVGEIPPMPDVYDDDFEAKLKARDESILAKARFEASNEAFLQQQQQLQQNQVEAKQRELNELSNSFFSNALSGGASESEINSVVTTLNNNGMTSDLGEAIMSDKADGYSIAKYLATNPMEAVELNTMSPVLAGAKLAEIKAKANVALKPKQSETPAPAEVLKGAGAQPDLNKYPNSSGAQFT